MTSDFLGRGAEGSTSAAHGAAICKRPGCGKQVPVTTRGRTRQFCSNECARRYHNDARGATRKLRAAEAEDPLARLEDLLPQVMTCLRAIREQLANADASQARAQLAEAEALRRYAEAEAAAARTALAAARSDALAARAEAERYARERDAARAALAEGGPAWQSPATDGDGRESPSLPGEKGQGGVRACGRPRQGREPR